MSGEGRRLSDKIMSAHAQACTEGKLEVAEALLRALEVDLSAIGGGKMDKRESMELLEEAFYRHQTAKQDD